jgi:DNA uptake protein ComE-like DNA-binding protein
MWSVITLSGWAVSITDHGGSAGGVLIVLGWAGAVASSFSVGASKLRLEAGSGLDSAVADAEQRLRERDHARRLALERPEVAREMGVGRPDLPSSHHAGLIDINNAPAAVLSTLPGVDAALAGKIVEARAETGFSSVDDLGFALDLDGGLIDSLRRRVVCLPR